MSINESLRPDASGRAGRRRRDDLIGASFIVLTSLQFGSVVVLGRVATRSGGLPVASLLALRFAIAAALLGGARALSRHPMAAAKGEGWRLVVLGGGGYAVEAAFFFQGLAHGTAAAVSLLFFTYPVLVALLAFVMGRGLPGLLLGGALIAAVAGAATVVVAGGGVEIDAAGVAFALGSAGTFSLYLVGAAAVLKRTTATVGAMWVSASAALGLAAFAAVTGSARLPNGWNQWGPVLGMAAFTAGAFACLFAGLQRLGAVRTSIISATEPLTAAVLAAVFLDETIRRATMVGGVLILAAAVAAALARGRQPLEPPVP